MAMRRTLKCREVQSESVYGISSKKSHISYSLRSSESTHITLHTDSHEYREEDERAGHEANSRCVLLGSYIV